MSLRSSGGSSGIHYSQYLAGWCDRCGRKRGTDGRCADCDGWWTSPMLTVGVPIIALGTTLLLALLPLLRHREYTPAYAAVAPVLSPASPHPGRYPLRVLIPPAVSSPASPYVAPRSPAATTYSVAPATAAMTPAVAEQPPSAPPLEGDNLRRLTEQVDGRLDAFETHQDAALWSQRHRAALAGAARPPIDGGPYLTPQVSVAPPSLPGVAAPALPPAGNMPPVAAYPAVPPLPAAPGESGGAGTSSGADAAAAAARLL